jgi:hypothetical protein
VNNVVNQIAFLRTSREFPEELHQLTVEVNKAYVDTANVVNNRIISIFPTNRPARDGENWFFNNQRQEGFRQVYSFTTPLPATINLGFKLASISQPTRCWGQYTDGTNFFGIIWGTNVAIAGQISFYLAPNASPSSDVITFLTGAGAPAVVSGFVVIEWISQV